MENYDELTCKILIWLNILILTDMRTDYLNQRALENIQPKCNAVELRICGHQADILWHQRLPQEDLIIVEGNNLEMSRNFYLYNLTLRHQAIFAEALNRSLLGSRGIENTNSGRKVNSLVGSLFQFLPQSK